MDADVPQSNCQTMSDTGVMPVPGEAEEYRNVRFLKVAGTSVSLWLFPERFSKSATCNNIANAGRLTALLLRHIWLATEGNLPEGGPLGFRQFCMPQELGLHWRTILLVEHEHSP